MFIITCQIFPGPGKRWCLSVTLLQAFQSCLPDGQTFRRWRKDNVVYSAGLATSYRNTSWKAAYPFGHGLSYSQFRYSTPKVVESLGRCWLVFPPRCLLFRAHTQNQYINTYIYICIYTYLFHACIYLSPPYIANISLSNISLSRIYIYNYIYTVDHHHSITTYIADHHRI